MFDVFLGFLLIFCWFFVFFVFFLRSLDGCRSHPVVAFVEVASWGVCAGVMISSFSVGGPGCLGLDYLQYLTMRKTEMRIKPFIDGLIFE